MMIISFIIPVYNCKVYLPACVESIRQVRAEDYEILLIDDGSTDGSGAVCDELAAKFPEIRVVHQPNAGASAARNRGLREARGKGILFLDSDDTVDSGLLRQVLETDCLADADLVIFGMTFDYYRKGLCYRSDAMVYPADGLLSRTAWGADFEGLFDMNSLSPLWNKVFRRDIIREWNLELDPGLFLYEDLEFVLRYLAHCGNIRNIPRAIYRYRQPEDEGNAGRRLARLKSVPELLTTIETALTALPAEVPVASRQAVLHKLYRFLTCGKIAVAGPAQIREICREHNRWLQKHTAPAEDAFLRRLRQERVAELYLSARITQLRHKIAVMVKAAPVTWRKRANDADKLGK